MRLRIYNSWYILENYDEDINILDFEDYDGQEYTQIISDIIHCFLGDDYRLFFCIIERQLNWLDNDEKKFIEERTVCINNEWAYNTPRPKIGTPRIRWYEAKNKSDITKVISAEWDFTCIITYKNDEIKDYEYILNVDECDEFNNLHIKERLNGNFLNIVLPKLKILLGDRLEVIYER